MKYHKVAKGVRCMLTHHPCEKAGALADAQMSVARSRTVDWRMARQAVTLAAALVVMALASWLPATETQTPPLANGPCLQYSGPDSFTVMYEMAKPAEGFVRYGSGGKMDQKVATVLHSKPSLDTPAAIKKKMATGKTAFLYRARLTGLAAGAEYTYEIVPSGDGPAVGPYTFRTFPTTTDRITFVGFGDTRGNPGVVSKLAASIAKHSPLFILHTGDIIDSGANYSLYGKQFFKPMAPLVDHVPLLPAIGNHEDGPENLLRVFDNPGGKTWYSFNCGPVHIASLDSYVHSPEVLKWLEQDLSASKAPWKIVFYHTPTFSYSGHHRTDQGRTDYLPIFERTGVDLVLTGHAHLYERFQPLARTGGASKQGTVSAMARPITFVISGAGGAPMIGSAKGPHQPVEFMAKAALEYEYCVLDVDHDSLTMRTLTPQGKEIDSLKIAKTNGQYDQSYLAQAKSMEKAILTLGAIPRGNPMAAVETIPTVDKPSPLSMAFVCQGLPEPVKLEVRLADASREAYAMEPVTLSDITAESKVDLKVRALKEITVQKREEKKDEVLSPELRLVVTARSMGLEGSYEVGPVVHSSTAPPEGEGK